MGGESRTALPSAFQRSAVRSHALQADPISSSSDNSSNSQIASESVLVSVFSIGMVAEWLEHLACSIESTGSVLKTVYHQVGRISVLRGRALKAVIGWIWYILKPVSLH